MDHLENESMIKISLWPCDSAGEDRWCSGNSWGNWGCFRKHRYGRNLHVLHMLMCLWLIMMFFSCPHNSHHFTYCKVLTRVNKYIYIYVCRYIYIIYMWYGYTSDCPTHVHSVKPAFKSHHVCDRAPSIRMGLSMWNGTCFASKHEVLNPWLVFTNIFCPCRSLVEISEHIYNPMSTNHSGRWKTLARCSTFNTQIITGDELPLYLGIGWRDLLPEHPAFVKTIWFPVGFPVPICRTVQCGPNDVPMICQCIYEYVTIWLFNIAMA